MKNLITIIVPVYNRANIIINTLLSIKNQSYLNWECLIIDDFSTDETAINLKKFIETDRRFFYYLNKYTKGAQGARNTGIDYSKGDFLIFFDSDNIMYQNCLELLLCDILKSNSDISTCFSLVYDIKSNKILQDFAWVNKGNIHEKLLKWETYVDNSSALISKNIINSIGRFDELCPSFQELDMHLRLSKIAIYSTVCEKLVIYNKNNDDSISQNINKTINGYFFILFKYNFELKKYYFTYLKVIMILFDLINNLDNRDDVIKYKSKLYYLFPFMRFRYFFSIPIKIYTKLKYDRRN